MSSINWSDCLSLEKKKQLGRKFISIILRLSTPGKKES